ncbi:hypothetical protein SAMN02745181_0468 [Rubritalea squalenifaciens DSM 18772]|uniref:Transposase n=2 Tax=Rubritalea TaxID=361050 RepID=A0A1M6CFP8_9BACT|nr:hypothetical protein [Rubritalea squalenifaciens]SHI59855.1 hypothetical protein SAMN02745181_0468 [Rubritalea squalenifaciens DSM 18772]
MKTPKPKAPPPAAPPVKQTGRELLDLRRQVDQEERQKKGVRATMLDQSEYNPNRKKLLGGE